MILTFDRWYFKHVLSSSFIVIFLTVCEGNRYNLHPSFPPCFLKFMLPSTFSEMLKRKKKFFYAISSATIYPSQRDFVQIKYVAVSNTTTHSCMHSLLNIDTYRIPNMFLPSARGWKYSKYGKQQKHKFLPHEIYNLAHRTDSKPLRIGWRQQRNTEY